MKKQHKSNLLAELKFIEDAISALKMGPDKYCEFIFSQMPENMKKEKLKLTKLSKAEIDSAINEFKQRQKEIKAKLKILT